MTHIINFINGALVVALFFVVIHLADQDMQNAAKLDAVDAQMLAAENRIQRAAQALCVAELGPGTVALWTREGDLVCRPAELVAGVAK